MCIGENIDNYKCLYICNCKPAFLSCLLCIFFFIHFPDLFLHVLCCEISQLHNFKKVLSYLPSIFFSSSNPLHLVHACFLLSNYSTVLFALLVTSTVTMEQIVSLSQCILFVSTMQDSFFSYKKHV